MGKAWRKTLGRMAWVAGWLACLPVLAQEAQFAPAQAEREVVVAQDRFTKGSALPAWVEPIAQLPATQLTEPTVVVLADTQLHAGELAYHVHRAITANTPVSLEQLTRFSLNFNPDYQRLDLHMLRVVRAGQVLDRLAASKVTFLRRETGLEQGVYTGNVTASVLIPDIRQGDVLEFKYTLSGQNPVLGGRFVQWASWDQRSAAEWRRVTLTIPAGREVFWRVQGDETRGKVAEPETLPVANGSGLRKLRWESRGFARSDADKDVPAGFIAYRYLQFSEFRDWNDVAVWAQRLFDTGPSRSAELDQLVAQFSSKPSAAERTVAALSWVQQEIRYFSLSLGESSHRPAGADETLKRRFGDCKDKSALLIELLRRMGIAARPVLVWGAGVRGPARMLPSPLAFDHAIVEAQVDGKSWYLDPTRMGQVGRLDALGQRWAGAEVLVANASTQQISVIPAPEKTGVTRDELHEKFTIAKFGGPGELQVRRTWSGVHAEGLRVATRELSDERVKKMLLEPYERRYPGYELVGGIRLENDSESNELSAVMTLKLPNPTISTAEQWRLNFEASNIESVLRMPESSTRRQPLALPFKSSYRYRAEYQLPEDVTMRNDPTSYERRGEGFTVRWGLSMRGSRARAHVDLDVVGDEVAPEKVADHMRDLRLLRNVDRGQIWVSKAALATMRAEVRSERPLKQRIEEQTRGRLQTLTNNIQGGQLKGENLAAAHCNRASVLSQLGNHEEALKEVELAVKLNPDSAQTLMCRGSMLAWAQRFDEAIEAYTNAIVLNPKVRGGAFSRGLARYESGRYAQAVADFRDGAGGTHANRLSSQVWLALALKRQGQSPAPEFAADAAADPKGEWPRPLLGMMYGLLQPDEVLELVASKTGDDREYTLAEAHYYVGQWYLINGDKPRAMEHFRKTVDQGVLGYIEHRGALFELNAQK